MRIGIYFGCFVPLHKGHEEIIRLAMKENDHLILGVCGYDNDRGKGYLPFRERIKLMTRIYGDKENVTLVAVDDKKVGLKGTFSLNAWALWSDELFGQASIGPHDTANQYHWYSGEQDYLEKLQELFPAHNVNHIPRTLIPISGTKIRNNTAKYVEYINPLFASYLAKRGLMEEKK